MEITKENVEKLLRVEIHDLSLYQNAFVHKSASKNFGKSNERLEFVGDSVLGLVVARYLYEKYPDENEGFLTRVRTKIVGGKNLAKFANTLGLQNYVVMNDKAMQNEWNKNPRILEDTFEALIGAMYLDIGLASARDFILETLKLNMNENEMIEDTNYKDMLMKHLQSNCNMLPEYKMIDQDGPDHKKYFTMQITLDKKTLGEGKGKSKKDAEQNAAMRVLKCLNKI